MKKKIQKVLAWFFELALFCGYFYVLFVNLVCGFGAGGIAGTGQIIKTLSVSFFLAAGLPGLLWYQHRRILKMEKLLDDLYDIFDKNKIAVTGKQTDSTE